MPLAQRTLLVTGASSGIGRAVARKLLAHGHTIIGTARNHQCFSTPHPSFTALALDLSRTDQLGDFAAELQRLHPCLDGVVFCAGYGRFGHLEEFSFSQISELMLVNFTAQAILTRALLPALKRQAHSHLIYIGSEAALHGRRKGSLYCASKFALRGFTQALREECGSSSVRVSLINPGMVDTEFFNNLNFMPGRSDGQSLRAVDIAAAVHYVLQTGRHMCVDELNLSPATHAVLFKSKNP